MATYSVNWSATLATAGASITAGSCAVSVSGQHLVASAANRSTYGRAVGLAASNADAGVPFQLIVTGLVPAVLTGLAPGAASWVRVSSSGSLERCTPADGDDLVGKSLPDGSVQFHPGVWDSTNYTGASGTNTATNLGSALRIFQDVTAGVIRHRTLRVSGEVSGEEDPSGFAGEVHIRPVPPGHFNPCDPPYGAVADWNGTRTGTIANGSNLLTVNDATGLFVGKKIAMRDVTGTKTITAIAGLVCTLDSAVDATISGQWVVTDNHDAFAACIADMAASGNHAHKMIAHGHFFIGPDPATNICLLLNATVDIAGAGRQWVIGDPAPGVPGNRSFPGTMFVFPKNTTGIRIKSTQSGELGGPTTFSATAATTSGSASVTFTSTAGLSVGQYITIVGVTGTKHLTALVGSVGTLDSVCDATVAAGDVAIVLPTSSGDKSAIRDLTICCNDTTNTVRGHGIYTTAMARLENLVIDGFGEDGVRVTGELAGNDGNADGGTADGVQSMHNKGRGFRFLGNDAQGWSIAGCSALSNIEGGFFDATRVNSYGGGNNSEGNTGPDWEITTSGSVVSGGYSEGDNYRFAEGVLTMGNLASRPTGAGAFHHGFGINGFGHAWGAPFQSINSFGPNYVRGIVGGVVDDPSMRVFGWEVYGAGTFPTPGALADQTGLFYLGDAVGWFSLQNGATYREVMRLPTQTGGALRTAPWFPNGVLFGNKNETPIAFTIESAVPDRNVADNQPLTYEVGYTIWRKNPTQGASLGWRCLSAGTIDGAGFLTATAATTSGSAAVTFSNTAGLAVGQYITIAGVTGTKRIVALSGTAGTLGSTCSATVVAGAVTFVSPTFEGIGVGMSASTTYAVDKALALSDNFVTVSATGKTMTLPASPFDGQTHNIKSKSGVTTTVNTSGGSLNIDGALTATVAASTVGLFRYSSAAAEWERR